MAVLLPAAAAELPLVLCLAACPSTHRLVAVVALGQQMLVVPDAVAVPKTGLDLAVVVAGRSK